MEAAASPDSESLEKKTTTKRFDGPNMVSSSLAGSIVCVSLLERRGTFPLDALPVALRAFRLGDRDVRLLAQDVPRYASALLPTVQVGQSPASMPPGPREDRCGPRTPQPLRTWLSFPLRSWSTILPSLPHSSFFYFLFSCTCILLTCQDSTWKQTQALPKREHANGTS